MFKVQTNKKTGLKIAIITLIAVLAVTAVLVPMFNRTSIAHASTSTPATFLRTRRGTINDPGSDRAFAAYDFQRDDGNFSHIEASDIANLNDNTYTYFGGNYYA